jgi:hypothetical protein
LAPGRITCFKTAERLRAHLDFYRALGDARQLRSRRRDRPNRNTDDGEGCAPDR